MSCSKMMVCLLLETICFALCSAKELSDSQPAIFKPAVMYTSPNSAVITWEKLRQDQEMDGYVIEYGKTWQNSKTLHVSRSSTTAMIPNLEPDTLYNIRVRVPDINTGGTYPGPSVSFRTRTPDFASIGVPQNIVAVPLPLYKLLVTWDLPYRARASDVVHYSLIFAPVYSPFLRKTSLLLPGHYKSFTLTYLRPNTLYKVKLAALLKNRKGPYSSWVIAQTVNQLRLDKASQPTTKKPYHHQTGKTGIMTSPSTHSTIKTTRSDLQLSTKRLILPNKNVTEENILTTPYQTKEQSSMRPVTATMEIKKSTTLQATEPTGFITEMAENSTQSSTQATEDGILVTTGQTYESTVEPSEHEKDETTQQTTRVLVTTEGKLLRTTQRTIAQALQRTTTAANQHTTREAANTTITTPSPSPPRHTEQVSETMTHEKTTLITEGTKAQTTVTKQVTEKTTQETLQQPTTQTNEQTTQKPTSSHLRTNINAVSGTEDILKPTTFSVAAVTDQKVTDSHLFSSSSSSRQPNIIITGSTSTMPNLVITGTLPTTDTQPQRDTCELLKPSMCSDIGYTATKMTSKEGQNEMLDHVKSIWSHLTPLCQNHAKLKQFLCAASFPYCSKELGGPFLPCRSMCMLTKKNCKMISKDWPAELDCSKFPDVGESAICISYGHESEAPTTTTIRVTQWSPVPPTDDPSLESQTTSTFATESSHGLETTSPAIVEPKSLPSHCESLYLKACDGVGYKYVQFPNFFNQTHQNDAGRKISKYWPLIELKCSPLFKLFLCSLYTPMCTSKITDDRNMLPCRSLCQQVTSECSYYMKVYGFTWPEGITCGDFPAVNDGTCLSQKYLSSIRQGNGNVLPTSPTTSNKAQVTIFERPSRKTNILTSPSAISVEQESTTVEFSASSSTKPISTPKENAKPTLSTQPKTGKNIKVIQNEQVENSTEAIVQRNEEDFRSSVKPATGFSMKGKDDHITSTKSSSTSSPTFPVIISPPSGCEGLTLKICQGVGYDFTQFPNFFNHKYQNDAGREVYSFWPLLEINCSPKLQLFICSLYAPICTKTFSSVRSMTGALTPNVLPCRSLCHQVKRECRTMMNLYDLEWPRGVECTNFPEDGEKTCIYGKTNDTDSKGLFKISKARKELSPNIPSTPLPGTRKCQPLPPDHPCKNHYEIASLSNASESFENIKKLIENHVSEIKDWASKKCLRNLEMFLCSVHTPRCLKNGTKFGPCRSQCKTMFRRCGALLLRKLNFEIVGLKDCRRFPMTRCTGNKRRPKPKSKSVESL